MIGHKQSNWSTCQLQKHATNIQHHWCYHSGPDFWLHNFVTEYDCDYYVHVFSCISSSCMCNQSLRRRYSSRCSTCATNLARSVNCKQRRFVGSSLRGLAGWRVKRLNAKTQVLQKILIAKFKSYTTTYRSVKYVFFIYHFRRTRQQVRTKSLTKRSPVQGSNWRQRISPHSGDLMTP